MKQAPLFFSLLPKYLALVLLLSLFSTSLSFTWREVVGAVLFLLSGAWLMVKWLETKTTAEASLLSGREKEVEALLRQRKSYKEISNELNIGINTVKTHVKNIYSKREVSNKSELITKLEHGF